MFLLHATRKTTGIVFQKHNAWIASSFGDFDEGSPKRTKQVNIENSLKTGNKINF